MKRFTRFFTKKQKTIRGYLFPQGGDISDHELDILANAYASAREQGYDKERASKIAWRAVNKNK